MTKKTWVRILLFFVIAVVALIVAFYCDASVQHWMAHHQNHTAKIVFRNVSRWGDWPTHAIIGGVLLLIAWLRGNKNWTRIFLTMLIACLLAGVSARVIKITTGRARPSVRTESVWNGPRFSSKYHAFPSGHTAASAAFFGTLLFVSLRLGLALMPIPLADRVFAHVCRRALPFRRSCSPRFSESCCAWLCAAGSPAICNKGAVR